MRRLLAALLLVAAPACTVGIRREASPSPTPLPSVSLPACRTSYAPPDPKRPRITLAFDLDDAHRVVTGTEKVVFTPDRPVTELVFRLWLNGPAPVANGGRIEVTKASLPMSFEAGNSSGGTQGTILRLALPAPAPAGKPITASLEFTMTLPSADVDRWGRDGDSAWWASAHPMLAWSRGHGWSTTPAVSVLGEAWVSEAAFHDVTVDAPSGDTVFGISVDDEPETTAAGKRRWRFTNPVARDAAVSVGRYETRRLEVDGFPVTIAFEDDLARGDGEQADFVESLTRQSLRTFTEKFGPFPYPALTIVAIDPVQGAGVEYPGFIWLGSRRYDVVVPHEIAHQWFYGLVGDDQGVHPWLDEAFASYAEGLVNAASAERFASLARSEGEVGLPMAHWDRNPRSFGPVVYAKGAGALMEARAAVGAPAFDAMLRCYVNEHAHQVAYPEDVAEAFAPAPRVLEILRAAGALP